MGHAAPKTPYRPPPDALRGGPWRWKKRGRRVVLCRDPSWDPRVVDPFTLEGKLWRAEVAFLEDEIDVEDFERLVEAALRDEEEPPPPGFRVVRNGQYVGRLPLSNDPPPDRPGRDDGRGGTAYRTTLRGREEIK